MGDRWAEKGTRRWKCASGGSKRRLEVIEDVLEKKKGTWTWTRDGADAARQRPTGRRFGSMRLEFDLAMWVHEAGVRPRDVDRIWSESAGSTGNGPRGLFPRGWNWTRSEKKTRCKAPF